MRTVGNVIWFVLAGVWLAMGYAIAGIIACCTIVAIPFGVGAFRLAGYVLWPFGRTVIPAPSKGVVSGVGNVVWAIVAGWWLALSHIITGVLLACTIIGIPFAVATFKMIPLAFAPFGKQIVPIDSVTTTNAIAVPQLG